MDAHMTNVDYQKSIGKVQNDYAKLPRSSGDGMESQGLTNDHGLIQTKKVTEVLQTSALVKPQILQSSFDKETFTATFKDQGHGQLNLRGSKEGLQPLLGVPNRTLPINRANEIQSKSSGKLVAAEQLSSSGNENLNGNHVPLESEHTCGTSLSMERKAECLDLQSLVKDLETQNQKLSEENEKLLNKLSVQSKVNADLKKLLVASVGEDIGARLEEMSTDKAQFDTTLKNLERDLEETSEELSKVSIECDVWRSKFLASRMMTNGLTDIKTTLFIKTRNCQRALQRLLEEQSDIRQHLRATNRLLQGIHKRTNSRAYQSTKKHPWQDFQKSSIVELSHINFNLAEDICHAVNPNHIYETDDAISSADEEIIPISDLTPAEQMACQVLKGDSEDADEMGISMDKISRQYIGNSYASRFLTNNFRITFDCCERCTGALKVV